MAVVNLTLEVGRNFLHLAKLEPGVTNPVHLSDNRKVFNLLNTANLIQYRSDLADTATFGQSSDRFTQVFGSGGPSRVSNRGTRQFPG